MIWEDLKIKVVARREEEPGEAMKWKS